MVDDQPPKQPEHRPFCTAEDIRALIQLPLSLAIAWLAPEQRLVKIAELSQRRFKHQIDAWAKQHPSMFETLLGGRSEASLDQALYCQKIHMSVLQLHLLRCLRPICTWRPPVTLQGREHLEAALRLDRGAILWIAPMVYAPLHAKAALAQAGFPISHLSRFQHGRFRSIVGIRVLNRLTTVAEDRYLAERITIGPALSVVAATRMLAQRLKRKGVVSITATRDGPEVIVPLLNGQLVIANGAAKLAKMAGAPLLPVFSLSTGPGAFQTVIEAPLEPELGESDPVRALHQAFARRIEHYALRYPDQLTIGQPSSVIFADPPTLPGYPTPWPRG